jgi:phosphatidylglycerol---prolipoprotein diacylglyceryl transferase
MRPEIIPNLLNFTVETWKVILYVGSIVMGGYTAVMTWLREGKTEQARRNAVMAGLTWAGGGVLATMFLAVPMWLVPDSLKHGGYVDLPLHTYGMMIAIGFIVAISLSAREARRCGIFPGQSPPASDEERERASNTVMDLAFWVLIAAIVGSRFYFIAVNWGGPEGYGEHPECILQFWTGGLVFYGGLLGSVAASIWYARRKGVNFLRLADVGMPTISIGQFFGRLGCLSAGCCWGKEAPAGFPLGLKFPPGSLAYDTLVNERHSLPATALHTPALYPTQLMDSIGSLLIFFILIAWVRPHKRYDGQVMLAWCFLYPLLRFSDEFFRGDIERGVYTSLHVSVGQITSIAIALVALGLLIVLRRRASAGQALSPAAA